MMSIPNVVFTNQNHTKFTIKGSDRIYNCYSASKMNRWDVFVTTLFGWISDRYITERVSIQENKTLFQVFMKRHEILRLKCDSRIDVSVRSPASIRAQGVTDTVFDHLSSEVSVPTIQKKKGATSIASEFGNDYPVQKTAGLPFISLKSSQTKKVLLEKKKQAEQVAIFEEYAKQQQWDRFHSDHYDWWMFPIDRPSASYNTEFQFSEEEIASLKNDPVFMVSYRRGVQLVALSYGWDTVTNRPVDSPHVEQRWRNYGVRLGKMAHSLKLLEEEDLFKSMQEFARQKVDYAAVEPWVLHALHLM